MKGTVLVIDDSPEVQRYLKLLLELQNYEVVTADNGEQGLQRVREGFLPTAVMLDMQMPGMNGLQTLRCLRDVHPELKIIMCSSEDDPEIIHQAMLLGAQAYLVKPVQRLYLSAALDRCVVQHANHSSPHPATVLTMPTTHLSRPN